MEDKPDIAISRHEGYKITENKYILGAAIALALLLAIQYIPQVNDFWTDHFVRIRIFPKPHVLGRHGSIR